MMKHKLLALAGGVIFSFLIFELLLRMIPELMTLGNDPLSPLTICNSKNLYTIPSIDKKNNKLIVSFGDSLTFGLGADKGFSEPEQLGKLLREDGQAWIVDNMGYPAVNTRQLEIRVKKYLEVNKPDLVLLRGGGANYWNSSLNPKGHHLKTWIFIKKLAYSLKDQIPAPDFLPLDQELQSQKSVTSLNFDSLPDEERNKKEFERACVLWEKKRILNLADKIVPQIQNGHYSGKGYYALPLCLQRIYHRDGSQGFTEAELERLNKYIAYSFTIMPEYSLLLNRYSPEEVENWIYQDMSKIVSLLQEKKIPVVIIAYPPDLKYLAPRANIVLRKVAKDFHIPFIDIESRFFELYAQGRKQDEYHAVIGGKLDMHLNNKGYGLSALWIYEKLKEAHMLN